MVLLNSNVRILGKLAYNAHCSSRVKRIQTAFNLIAKTALAAAFGPCPQNATGQLERTKQFSGNAGRV